MKLSMTGEYAIMGMLYLSKLPNGSTVQISQISKECNISESLLRKIIVQLKNAGLVFSIRGKNGGVILAKDSSAISLLDIIEAIEGKIFLNKCLIADKFCGRIKNCAVHSVWRKVQNQMNETLNNVSLKSLSEEELMKTKCNVGG